MAFPTISTVIDNFNRANGGLGTNYTRVSPGDADPTISSNTVTIGAGTYATACWNPATFGPDTESFVTVTSAASGRNVWLSFRVQTPNTSGIDCYTVWYDGNGSDSNISRKDNDVDTQLGANISTTITAGQKLGGSVVGTTISMFKTTGGTWGAAITTRTDSTYTGAGNNGFGVQGATIDDFAAGTTVVAGSSSPPLRPNRRLRALVGR